MSTPRGTVLRAMRALVTALRPLDSMLADASGASALLADLGIHAPLVPPSLLKLRALVQQLSDALAAVEDLLKEQDESSPHVMGKIADLGIAAKSLFSLLHDLPQQLQVDLASYPNLLAEVDVTEIVKRLSSRFLIEYLRESSPAFYNALMLLGLLEVKDVAAGSEYAPGHTHYAIRADRVSIWFTDPAVVLTDVYGWGTTAFDHQTLLVRLQYLLLSLGYPGMLDQLSGEHVHDGEVLFPGDVELHLPIFSQLTELAAVTMDAIVRPTMPPDANDTGLLITMSATGQVARTIELTPDLLLTLDGDFEVSGGIGIEVKPPFRAQPVASTAAGTQAAARVALELALRPGDDSRIVFLDQPGLLVLSFADVATRAEVDFRSTTEPELQLEGRLLGGLLEIVVGDGDGFLQKILPKDGIRVDFDLTIGFSNKRGLYFKGGAGLEATLPVNIDFFGVIKIDSVYLALLAKGDEGKESKIQAVTATTVKVQLGPVSAIVERFGLQATLSFPEKGGNLGVANLDLGFKPPKGVGLTIKAQVVTGGGYLYFEKEQYAGVLQLEIAQKFSLSAVGLLTTKMPDGSKGFSLLVIISVRFDPGIQLGYGFSLNGLGGLLGVNRTAMAEVLREGLRRGALGSVLFPQHIVENAPQIISNLSAIFPPAQDRFLFGPMAIIGWGGSPPILSMEIGIILELPEPVRLMVLGRLRVTLPAQKDDPTQVEDSGAGDQAKKQDTPKIKLQLDSLGIFNFGTGDISLDAYLYDSTIGPFTLTGGMALRASFGAHPLFLLSVGGFHPAFQAPAGFPSIERVALGLHKKESGVEVRLQLAAYFALTSNTVQFGAHLDLYVHVWEIEIVGLLGFDALIQFQPFGLIASFEAMVSVKAFGQTLMAVGLQVNVTGPSPWHVWGKAQFTLLFFSGTAEFDALIGHEETPPLPPPIDVEQELLEELQKLSNWSSQLPVGAHPLVTFRDSALPKDQSGTPPKKKVFIHPLAELHVNQRLVPLNTDPITRYGSTTPTGATTFVLEANVSGEADVASLLSTPPLSDWFARAQFYVMSDAEKLAAPSFEEKNSGVRVRAVEGYTCGKPVGSVIKAAQTSKNGIQSNLEATKFLDRVAHLGAAGQAPIRAASSAKYGDPSWWDQGITLRKAGYRVVDEEDDGATRKVRTTRRSGASSPSSLFTETMDDMAAAAEPVLSYSAAQARATQAKPRAPKRRAWVVPDIGRKRG